MCCCSTRWADRPTDRSATDRDASSTTASAPRYGPSSRACGSVRPDCSRSTFPALPEALTQVDVDLANLVRRSSTSPVTPVGEVPTAPAARPISDVPGPAARSTSAQRVYRDPGQEQRVQSIQINQVVSAPGRTSMEWTLSSLTEQFGTSAWQPPVSSTLTDQTEVVDTNVSQRAADPPATAARRRRRRSPGSPRTSTGATRTSACAAASGSGPAGLRHDGRRGQRRGQLPRPAARNAEHRRAAAWGRHLSDIRVIAACRCCRSESDRRWPDASQTWVYDDREHRPGTGRPPTGPPRCRIRRS